MKKLIATIIIAAATVACVPGTASTDAGCKAVRDAVAAGEGIAFQRTPQGVGFWSLAGGVTVVTIEEDTCWNFAR